MEVILPCLFDLGCFHNICCGAEARGAPWMEAALYVVTFTCCSLNETLAVGPCLKHI